MVKKKQELKNQEITEDRELALRLERYYIKYKEREVKWNLRKTMQYKAGGLTYSLSPSKKKRLDPGRRGTKVSRK